MVLPYSYIKVPTLFLLVILLCLPVYGPDYFSEYLSTTATHHSGFVCDHAGADSGHESQHGHQNIHHCHELDAPCITSSGPVLDHSPIISILASSDRGALLEGYGFPFDIPPENLG